MVGIGRLSRRLGHRARRSARRASRERLRWTVRVRGTVIAVFLLVAIAARASGALPSSGPALLAAAAGAVMNGIAARRVARWKGIPSLLLWTGAGDVLLITFVVATTGGAASPFLFLYVVQVATTALVVDGWLGAVMGLASVASLAAASWLGWPGGRVIEASAPSARALWLASLGVTLLFLVFVGGYLTRRLTRSERQLALAHRRLARSLRRLTAAHASLQDAYTRLARAEAELIETDRMQTLQLLVAGVAHELGNPLAVLAGTIEPLTESVRAYERALALLAAGAAAGAEGAERAAALAAAAEVRRETPLLLANCAEATSRAVGLLGQLRDFGRGGRGTVRRLAPLAPGLAGTLALVRFRLPPGATVDERYDDVPEVLCVPAELNQVFINLLMNAIDVLAPDGHLRLGLAREGDEVCVTVRDDGPGIAPDVLPRIFEPFVTTKEAGRGTGLGLAISRAIVARHGGRITVVTAPGRGTTFTVRLPVPDAAARVSA